MNFPSFYQSARVGGYSQSENSISFEVYLHSTQYHGYHNCWYIPQALELSQCLFVWTSYQHPFKCCALNCTYICQLYNLFSLNMAICTIYIMVLKAIILVLSLEIIITIVTHHDRNDHDINKVQGVRLPKPDYRNLRAEKR